MLFLWPHYSIHFALSSVITNRQVEAKSVKYGIPLVQMFLTLSLYMLETDFFHTYVCREYASSIYL